MNIHFNFKNSDSSKLNISVLVDQTECGVLSMDEEAAECFAQIVKLGCSRFQSEFTFEGDLALREDWVLWHTRIGEERRGEKDRRCGLERRSGEKRRNGEN